MADRELRIVSKSEHKGSGLKQLNTDLDKTTTAIKDVTESIKDLPVVDERVPESFQELNDKAEESNDTFTQLSGTAEDLERSIKDIGMELTHAEDAWQDANKHTIALKKEFKELRQESGTTKQELAEMSQKIRESEDAEQKAINATRILSKEYDEFGGHTARTEQRLGDLNRKLDRAEGYLNGLTPATKRASKDMQGLTKQTGKVADALSLLTKLGVGAAIASMMGVAKDAIVDFVKDSTKAYQDFDDNTRRVFAQAPQLSGKMRETIASDAKIMAVELGRLPEETLPALRKALNLGVSETGLMGSISDASRIARVESADLIETLVLGESVVNAYGREVTNVGDVYDRLTFITQNSNLELNDLNQGMNGIISAAAEAGVGLDEVSAAIITMNRQGDDFGEIGDLLSNVLTQLTIEGSALGMAFKESAGVGFVEFKQAGGSLIEGLQVMQTHSEETGVSLLNMVGGSSSFFRDVQAARGVVELTGRHLDEMAHISEGAANALGLTAKSSEEFAGSLQFANDQAEASTAVLKLQIGEALEPATRRWLELKLAAAEALGSFVTINSGSEELRSTMVELGAGVQLTRSAIVAVGKVTTETGVRMANATEYTQRSAIAQKLVTEGFEGTTAELRNLIEAEIQQEELAERQVEIYAELSEVTENYYGTVYGGLDATTHQTGLIEEQVSNYEALSDITTHYVGVAWEELDVVAQLNSVTEEAEEQATEYAAALEAEAFAQAESLALLEAKEQAFGRYALQALGAIETEINWTDELFKSAAQKGVNVGMFEELARASGVYDEQTITTMITQAKMRMALEEVTQGLQDGTLSTNEAIGALNTFSGTLEKDYTAEFDYASVVSGIEGARALRTALVEASGNYSATFTTTHETRNTAPTGVGENRPRHGGGDIYPNQPYLVGDDQQGNVIPGVSELVFPDQPGYVMSGRDTAELFNRQGSQTSTPTPTEINFNLTLQGVHEDNVTQLLSEAQQSLQEAAQELGLVPE